jgi:hypothetical protein
VIASAFWLSVGLNIVLAALLLLVVPIVWEIHALKYEQVWQIYHLDADDGKRRLHGLQSIGRFKEMREEPERNRYCLVFKKGMRIEYYYSSWTKDMLVSQFLIHKYLIIYYALNCFCFKKVLPEDQQYARRREYPWYYHIIVLVEKLFTFKSAGGLAGTVLIALGVATVDNSNFSMFFAGLGIGALICIVLTYLSQIGLFNVVAREETVTEEWWLEPIFPSEVTLDLYKVKFIRQEIEQKGDKTPEVEAKPEKRKKITLLELNEMELDPRVEVIKYKRTGTRTQMMSVEQIQNLGKTYMFKVRSLWEQIHALRAETTRLQGKNKNLNQQIQTLESERDKEIEEYNTRVIAERQRGRESLKSIAIKMFGEEVVDQRFEDVMHTAFLEWKQLNDGVRFQKLDLLTKMLSELLTKIAEKQDIDLEALLPGIQVGSNDE